MLVSVFSLVFNFIGALAMLLWGMDLLSTGIQKGAGNKLQKLLSVVSGNRFTAVLTGLLVTSIIQSSSATTVMVVSFVNAQIITLTQAIGIIFGANIGTTITAWIVSFLGFSFKISAFAIPLIGIGFFMKSIKKYKLKDFGDMFLGFGMLFLGLDLLGNTLSLSPESVGFINNITSFGFWGILIGVLLGAFLTAIIHSSSAFTAIVLTLAANGAINWELSAALVLGSNIGTTIDAVLSSLGWLQVLPPSSDIDIRHAFMAKTKPLCTKSVAVLKGSSEICSQVLPLSNDLNTGGIFLFPPFLQNQSWLAR